MNITRQSFNVIRDSHSKGTGATVNSFSFENMPIKRITNLYDSKLFDMSIGIFNQTCKKL